MHVANLSGKNANTQTKQGDIIDVGIAQVVMGLGYTGVRMIVDKSHPNAPRGDVYRCEGGAVPIEILRYGPICNGSLPHVIASERGLERANGFTRPYPHDSGRITSRLDILCLKGLLEHETARYRPHRYPFIFEWPTDGSPILSEVVREDGVDSWRLSHVLEEELPKLDDPEYLERLEWLRKYLVCKPISLESRKTWDGRLRDFTYLYLLDGDGLIRFAMDFYRLTTNGIAWAEGLMLDKSEGVAVGPLHDNRPAGQYSRPMFPTEAVQIYLNNPNARKQAGKQFLAERSYLAGDGRKVVIWLEGFQPDMIQKFKAPR